MRAIAIGLLLGAMITGGNVMPPENRSPTYAPRAKPPRYSPPSNGEPGRVNVVEYFSIDDPRVASNVLLEEAAKAQVDVDRTDPRSFKSEIVVPSGRFSPSEMNQLTLPAVPTSPNAADAGDGTVCLVKLKRGPSIREIAGIMSDGIRIYRALDYHAYVVRVPHATMPVLQANPLVEWVGAFLPAHKIPPSHFDPSQPVMVVSLVRDQADCREDLIRIGASVREYNESIGDGWARYTYTIDVDTSLIPKIAEFWWVAGLEGEHTKSNRSGP